MLTVNPLLDFQRGRMSETMAWTSEMTSQRISKAIPSMSLGGGGGGLDLLKSLEDVGEEEGEVYIREHPDDVEPRFMRHGEVGLPMEKTDPFGKRSKAAGEHFWREQRYIPV